MDATLRQLWKAYRIELLKRYPECPDRFAAAEVFALRKLAQDIAVATGKMPPPSKAPAKKKKIVR